MHFRKFISKLPDKGKKIISFHDKLLKEFEYKNEVKKAANLLSELNIASKGKKTTSKIEWTGKNDNDNVIKVIELDSDDEEDPLKILAQVAYNLCEALKTFFSRFAIINVICCILIAYRNRSSQEESCTPSS